MTHDEDSMHDLDATLDAVPPSRRSFVKGLVAGAAYAAPLVASFSLSALTAEPAMAQSSNVS